MKLQHRFYMVDVFAENPYSGNPLAVIVSAEDLPVSTMQKIAAEMNFSETTFVSSAIEVDGGYRVRIFTPSREIEFTGHPILGTAAVIRQHLVTDPVKPVNLNLAVGRVTVTFDANDNAQETAWFRSPPITLGAIADRKLMAGALGISVLDIDDSKPIQMLSAGTAAMMVPLLSQDALKRCQLDLNAYAPLAAQGFPPLVYLYCSETHDPDNDLCARFFFDAHGVREDPATGNGAAFLGAYLLAHEAEAGKEKLLRIEQGFEVQRPSLIFLRTAIKNGTPQIHVGGYVVATVQGELV